MRFFSTNHNSLLRIATNEIASFCIDHRSRQMAFFPAKAGQRQPRPQGLLLDDFRNGGSSIRHFENRRGEGPGDEVGGKGGAKGRFSRYVEIFLK